MTNATHLNEFQLRAIDLSVGQNATIFLPELEYTGEGSASEVVSTPLCDALGWTYTRFGNTTKNRTGLGFVDAYGIIWQVKVFGAGNDNGKRSGKYFAPKGNGDVVYYPPVPRFTAQLIAAKYGVKPPCDDEDFWTWILKHKKIRIVITEAGYKALSQISAGIPAVAFYGCTCGVDANGDLKDPKLAALVKGREISIAFDEDGENNPKALRSVMAGTHKLSRAIKRAGGKPFVAEWQTAEGKGIDDVAANHGYDRVNEIIDSSLAYAEWVERDQKIKLIEQYRRGRAFTPTQVINTSKLPDGILDGALTEGTLIGLLAGMGTGKTYQLVQLAKKGKLMGLRLIVLGYRNGLLRSFQARLNDVGELAVLLIDEDPIMAFSQDHLLACHHSIGKLTPDRFEDAIVVLDEAVSVIKDVLNTKLKGVGNRRREHIDQLQACIANAHSVIALDANLDDRTIAAIRDLRSFSRIELVEDTYRQSMTIEVFDGTQKGLDLFVQTAVEQAIDVPILFTSNNKKTLKILRQMLLARGVENSRISLVTQDTAGEDETIGFLACPDTYIAQNQPQAALISPTGESGLDISQAYFRHHYHAHSTITDINSGTQFLGRERNFGTCPKSIWIEDKSLYSERGYGVVSHCNYDNLRTHAIAAVSDSHDQVADLAGAYPMLNQFRELQISQDIEQRYFAELFIERLSELGHHLTFVKVDETDQTIVVRSGIDRAAAKERVQIEDAAGYLAADESKLTRSSAAKILSRNTSKLSEKRAAEKFFFKETYPGLDQTEYWNTQSFWLRFKITAKDLPRQLERLYLLLDPDRAKTTTRKNLSELHKTGGLLRDLDRLSVEAQAADLAQLKALIGHTYSKSDPLLVEVVNKLSRCRGIFPKQGSQSPVQYISQIADKFGLVQSLLGQTFANRERSYTLTFKHESDPILQAVFNAITNRYDLERGCDSSNPEPSTISTASNTQKVGVLDRTLGSYNICKQGCDGSNPLLEMETAISKPQKVDKSSGGFGVRGSSRPEFSSSEKPSSSQSQSFVKYSFSRTISMANITKGSGNVFEDCGFPPEEAADLKLRTDLMLKLRNFIRTQNWTNERAASYFGESLSRISHLMNIDIEHFSVEQLVHLLSFADIDVDVS
jgi:predicted XRE-type DNA-binding protein